MNQSINQSINESIDEAVFHAGAKNALFPFSSAQGGAVPHLLVETLAGAVGGGFQGLVLSPTLLLKTRVMTNPVFRTSMSMVETTAMSTKLGVEVIQTEGLAALMKGSGVFATKRVVSASIKSLNLIKATPPS